MIDVREYQTASGRSPFADWLRGLSDRQLRARVMVRINRLRLGNFGDCKSVGEGVFGLRMMFGPGYRVYFSREGETVLLLLCGGDKSTQAAGNDIGENIGAGRMAKTRSYQETLKQTLKDPEDAAAYLNAALEENDPAAFLLALKDVAELHGGMAKVAEAAELNRENLYRILSENGNPRITSLNAILNALGLRLFVAAEKSRRSVA